LLALTVRQVLVLSAVGWVLLAAPLVALLVGRSVKVSDRPSPQERFMQDVERDIDELP
jgi:hypothetical protein